MIQQRYGSGTVAIGKAYRPDSVVKTTTQFAHPELEAQIRPFKRRSQQDAAAPAVGAASAALAAGGAGTSLAARARQRNNASAQRSTEKDVRRTKAEAARAEREHRKATKELNSNQAYLARRRGKHQSFQAWEASKPKAGTPYAGGTMNASLAAAKGRSGKYEAKAGSKGVSVLRNHLTGKVSAAEESLRTASAQRASAYRNSEAAARTHYAAVQAHHAASTHAASAAPRLARMKLGGKIAGVAGALGGVAALGLHERSRKAPRG